MHAHIIEAMLHALRPALKSQAKAKQILEAYWSDKMALVWNTEDVHRAANEVKTALTQKEALQVLETLHRFYNAQAGLKWEDLTTGILDSGLGRDLTQRELHRFVKKDLLTIHRQ